MSEKNKHMTFEDSASRSSQYKTTLRALIEADNALRAALTEGRSDYWTPQESATTY